MYKQYQKDNNVNVSSNKQLNSFCNDFSLFKIVNAGRTGANLITFEYYGEIMSKWRANMITRRYNELFTDRNYTLFFEIGNSFEFNYYTYSGNIIGQSISISFDYSNSNVIIAGISYKVIEDKTYVCKKSRGNVLKCYDGIQGLAKTLAGQNNPESPLNSWGYNVLTILGKIDKKSKVA